MIYLDYNASTPCLPSAAQALAQALVEQFGNPSARQHRYGREAAEVREACREQAAALLGCYPDELYFTSGATESCNHAILGVAEALLAVRPHFYALASEHSAVLAPLARCALAGAKVHTLPINHCGQLEHEALASLSPHTALVAVQAANNETGVRQDLAPVVRAAHAVGALVLCDASQALGRLPVHLHAWGVDLACFSAHKAYGPRGVGLLYKRRGLALAPLLHGGGQEQGLRSGTENIPALAGFRVSLEWLHGEGSALSARLAHLQQFLEGQLQSRLPGLIIHGQAAPRLPGTTMLAHPLAKPGWLGRITRFACSGASSCSTPKSPSHVLRAMGCSAPIASNSLRLSCGWQTTEHELEQALEHVVATLAP